VAIVDDGLDSKLRITCIQREDTEFHLVPQCIAVILRIISYVALNILGQSHSFKRTILTAFC
jgi:hypothetical protein